MIENPNHILVSDPLDLKSLSLSELEQLAVREGEPAFRGRQIFRWLYAKTARDIREMTDLPAAFRERLVETTTVRTLDVETLQVARDGTIKGLLILPSGRKIEAVLIPDFEEEGDVRRLTVCVSSQVGCAMACSFCATGQMGFQENLTSGQIYDQVRMMDTLARERYNHGVTNIVFMGMGEPLLNYGNVRAAIEKLTHKDGMGLSPRRITVSTVGLARRIKELADARLRVNLAVSLHAPEDAKRSSIMPVNRAAATDLTALKEALQYYSNTTGQRITYEYCMFQGFNDSEEDARNLVRVSRWAASKVNLIMYNPVPGLGFERTSEDRLEAFIRILVRGGVTVTVRRSRGQDIDAACGQLAARKG